MIIAIDILLGVIILASLLIGIKQGFIKSIVGFLRYIIAYMIANALYPSIASVLRKLIGIETVPISDEKTGIISFIKAIPEKLATVDTDTAREMFMSALFEVAAFILIFVVVVLLIKLLAWIIEKNTHLPGLGFVNRFLGGVFGLFCGLLWTWMLASVFSNYLLDFLIEKDPVLFYPEMRDNFLVNFCANTNPLSYLFNAVDAFASLFQF